MFVVPNRFSKLTKYYLRMLPAKIKILWQIGFWDYSNGSRYIPTLKFDFPLVVALPYPSGWWFEKCYSILPSDAPTRPTTIAVQDTWFSWRRFLKSLPLSLSLSIYIYRLLIICHLIVTWVKTVVEVTFYSTEHHSDSSKCPASIWKQSCLDGQTRK